MLLICNSDVIPYLILYPAGQIMSDIQREWFCVEFIQRLSWYVL